MRTLKFSEIFSDHTILTERDRVARNTRNDYGLPNGWIFITGHHVGQVWITAWGLPTPELRREIEPQCSAGELGQIELRPTTTTPEGIYAIYNSRNMITHRRLCDSVTEIPIPVLNLIVPRKQVTT